MNSVILQLASRYVRALLITFAIIALFRGHNYPGGGFIGGLLAGLSIVYKGFAYTPEIAKQSRKSSPAFYIGIGLLCILLSVIPGVLAGKEVMTGIWLIIPVPLLGELKLGTPFLFDIGVFLAVIGVTISFLFSLTYKEAWK